MSTRTYPLFRRGNPQLRVFLPNFWMKMVQREHEKLPSNKVNFIVSSEMTRIDVKNYLEKIYNVPVMDVRTVHVLGKIQKHKYLQETIKEDDYKMAFVTLPKDFKFEFPDVVKEDKREQDTKKYEDDIDQAKQEFKKATKQHKQKGRTGLPSFFGL